ncbi:MAG: hypothetical protein JJU13_02620 [Balneolaceae bacterium]|nr:hypothetical protein [Balneolaceae bacterium]
MEKQYRYNEKEITEIFKLALNRQESKEGTDEPGLTLEEIQKIGRETGMNPEELRRAADQVRLSTEMRGSRMITDSSEVQAERWISGRTDDNGIENVFAALRNQMGSNPGWWGKADEIKKLGNTHECYLKGARVTITDQGNGYLVQVFMSQFFNGKALEAAILSFPVAFIAGVLPVAAAAEFLNITWAVLAAILAYSASFAYMKKVTAQKRKEVFQQLTGIASEAERLLSEKLNQNSEASELQKEKIQLPAIENETTNTTEFTKEEMKKNRTN